MSTSRNRRPRRIALGIVAAITIAACGGSDNDDGSDTTPPETAAPVETPPDTEPQDTEPPVDTEVPVETDPPEPVDPCDPVGTLNTNVPNLQLDAEVLNDRCVDDSGAEIEWEKTDFAELGIWTLTDAACGPHELITAVQGQVLVTSDVPGGLSGAVDEVVARLSTSFDVEAMGSDVPTAELVRVEGAPIEEIVALLPTVQGVGWSADLNYLEPLQPNNGFRPDDDPRRFDPKDGEFPDPRIENPDGAQVLVLDSTADATDFDVDMNGRWDEDHGHGLFVQSIIDRLAPDVGVRLEPVTLDPTMAADQLLDSGRWAPMMFSDMDILTAMHAASPDGPTYEFVNMSLGGPGCTTSTLGHGVGERVALARGMKSMSLDSTVFIAAAGNQGGDVRHFPAAWRDSEATTGLAAAVASLPVTHVDIGGVPVPVGDVAADIDDLHGYFVDRVYAVGSVETDGSRSAFSNCGGWVNATAYGSDQVGSYPHPDNEFGYAIWSGTSFATANVTAQLASGIDVLGVTLDLNGLECPTAPDSDATGSGTSTSEPEDDPDGDD